jgi:tRNA G46 methylase TrmB
MKKKSNNVTSNQPGTHEDLVDILTKYRGRPYRRPPSDFSKTDFKELVHWLNNTPGKGIILDMGCGVGESSYHLAHENQDDLIVGIDKSLSRLERNNQFKEELPKNLYLMRGELLDLWFLLTTSLEELNKPIIKQYILYPNPWPKKKHIKRRWHGNPIFPFLLQLNCEIELRTNWSIYAEEFSIACGLFDYEITINENFIPLNSISPFEKKFLDSKQLLFKTIVTPAK